MRHGRDALGVVTMIGLSAVRSHNTAPRSALPLCRRPSQSLSSALSSDHGRALVEEGNSVAASFHPSEQARLKTGPSGIIKGVWPI